MNGEHVSMFSSDLINEVNYDNNREYKQEFGANIQNYLM